MFELGVERLLNEKDLQAKLFDKRLAFLGHPASVTKALQHSLEALAQVEGFTFTAGFGPQHGMRGEKQDNMIESDDYLDPIYKIPVHSLYGEHRRPTEEMLKGWDVLLIDMQDVGCRIYTFLTTLFYMMDAVEKHSEKEIWILDRPNPAGRPVEGHILDPHFETFVGVAALPMRHGLTLGEAALWYKNKKGLKLNLSVIGMKHYDPLKGPLYGWPEELSWVNPSPNMPRLSNARQYAGSVLIEGTRLSEGRGTTIPLEIVGAPGMNSEKVLTMMRKLAPHWLNGCKLRACYFEPTFHKFKGEMCSGIQVHTDNPVYNVNTFLPYRLYNIFLKAFYHTHPDFDLWRKPPYEYETVKMPIDILSGHAKLRDWVEDKNPRVEEWDRSLKIDEDAWIKERKAFLLY
jgi:uncharacterized protein YbbC (DUF1343 family)